MAVSAADVKRLREETDAPMMECRAALDEAGGDFDKAKEILREKGKAAAAKRADRATSEGNVAVAVSEDGKSLAIAVLECETDFVAKNVMFQALANDVAQVILNHRPAADPLDTSDGKETLREKIEQGVGKIRENIQLKRAERITVLNGKLAYYVHHDHKKGAVVVLKGDSPAAAEVGKKLAIQVVALTPKFVRKTDVPQDIIEKEMEIEVQRAINEGKPENIAKNIAQGRINKEFYQAQVLLEQPFYADQKQTVGAFVAAEAKAAGGTLDVDSFVYLTIGEA